MMISDVVNYVYARVSGTYMRHWTWGAVSIHVQELVAQRRIISHSDGKVIDGVGIFNPNDKGGRFTIQQVWGTRLAFTDFIHYLETNYPFVTEVYGNRGDNHRQVKFNLETLKKVFYGSRRTSTSTTRVHSQNA